MMEVEQPLAAEQAMGMDQGMVEGEQQEDMDYGEEGEYYEGGMDIDDLPVTQEDAWAVIR
jgi:hypothetical protein